MDVEKVKKELEWISSIINCKGCDCCDAGLIYVFPEEVGYLKLKEIKVIQLDQAFFIPQEQERCIYNKNSECLIYEDRPICCRLFPFDLFLDSPPDSFLKKETNLLHWVYYKKCSSLEESLKDSGMRRAIIDSLKSFERVLEEKDIVYWRRMILEGRRLEYGKFVPKKYEKLLDYKIIRIN